MKPPTNEFTNDKTVFFNNNIDFSVKVEHKADAGTTLKINNIGKGEINFDYYENYYLGITTPFAPSAGSDKES